MSIKVIDAPCGAGKTSWAIQEFKKNPEKQYIYVTPLLDEIERIQKTTEGYRCFKAPQYEKGQDGTRKLYGFNRLLANGDNIALTHSTFSNADDETLQLLQDSKPVLVLDETLDILVDFNDTQPKGYKLSGKYTGNISILKDGGYIRIDEFSRVQWISDKSYPDSAFREVERLAKNGNLLWLDNRLLLWEFPPQIFQYFSEVYVLTYLFDGSYLKPFFEYHRLEYEKIGVQKNNGEYELCPYVSDSAKRQAYKQLITIDDHLNHYRDGQLTSSGQDRLMNRSKPTDLSLSLSKDLYNFFQNICHARAEDILWTCKKEYKGVLKGKGYTCFWKEEGGGIQKKVECFLPLNARASNAYQDRHNLAYVYNMNSNPSYDRYFSKHASENGTPIAVNGDIFALGCLIQWVWRSAIRKGEPINLFLPAPRMRRLLNEWLDGSF